MKMNMDDEQHHLTSQKKLSFSIANILDRPEPIFFKLKHHNDDDDDDGSIHSSTDVDDDESCSEENGISTYYHHQLTHRKKKTRTVFSRTQIFQLETTFDRKRYLSSADRANLAQGLRLTEQQVKVKIPPSSSLSLDSSSRNSL